MTDQLFLGALFLAVFGTFLLLGLTTGKITFPRVGGFYRDEHPGAFWATVFANAALAGLGAYIFIDALN